MSEWITGCACPATPPAMRSAFTPRCASSTPIGATTTRTAPGRSFSRREIFAANSSTFRQMIAKDLKISLHRSFVEAREKRHELITVEHLLLELLKNPTAAEVLRGCGA